MRTIPQDLYERLDALLDSGLLQWVVAIELTTGQAFYLTPNNEPILHNEITFIPFPMEVGDFTDSGDGNLPSTTLSLSNVGHMAMPYLEGVGWDQARVVFKLVYVPTPEAEVGVRIDLVVQGAVATHEAVTLNLAQPNYMDRPYPPRRFLRNEGFPGIPRN
jgi:hypothetical protein